MTEPMPELLTRQEAAAMLKIHVDTLKRWEKKDQAPRRIVMGRTVRYDRDDVTAFLRERIQGQMSMFLGHLSGSVEVTRADAAE